MIERHLCENTEGDWSMKTKEKTQNLNVQKHAIAQSEACRHEKFTASIIALILGVFMIIGVGFAPMEIVHNAAHDTRHSLSFPCH